MVIALAVSGGAAWAQADTGQSTSSAEVVDDPILVVARSTERRSIDSTTFVVRDTVEARSSNGLDLLSRIPSLEVTPAGQLRLLGRGGVRVLIDGGEVTNPTAVLRNLTGSQVAMIEVATNPSARYSAQGTAGVINVITRRSFGTGLRGSGTASVGDYGTFDVRASPSWSRGRIALSGSIGVARTVAPLDFRRARTFLDSDGAPLVTSTELGTLRNETKTSSGNFHATFTPTPGQTLSLRVGTIGGGSEIARQLEITSELTGASGRQRSIGLSNFRTTDLSIDYRWLGQVRGEVLSMAARRSETQLSSDTDFFTAQASPGNSLFHLDTEGANSVSTLSVDYVRPRSRRIFSVGASYQRTTSMTLSRQSGTLPNGQIVLTDYGIDGVWTDAAFYLSYQAPVAGFTALIGLRAENHRYELGDVDAGEVPEGLRLFPSFHIERSVTSGLSIRWSYSQRISWPSIVDLDGRLRFVDATTASVGNPALRPELTDSFETRLNLDRWQQALELTIFYRGTRNLRSALSQFEDGVLVTRPVNLGERDLWGASLSVRGALGRRIRYVLAGNVSDQSIDGTPISLDLSDSGLQYGGYAELEFGDRVQGRRGADHLAIRMRYSGPVETGLVSISPYFSASATWSHALTDRLSAVFAVTDLTGPPTVKVSTISGTTFSRQADRARGPRVTFSLNYALPQPGQR